MGSLRISLTSDFMCPWCYIGLTRLERAVQQMAVDAQATWVFRPFLLEPGTPAEGLDLRDNLRRKYGDPEPLFRRVEQVAAQDGLAIDFTKVRKGYSSVRAHTLVAEQPSLPLVKGIFRAYFSEGKDISSMDVLIELAERVGLSRDQTINLIERPEAQRAIRQQAASASVRAVPALAFGGPEIEVGPVAGALSVAEYCALIERVLPKEA